jgi:hypothetical protein
LRRLLKLESRTLAYVSVWLLRRLLGAQGLDRVEAGGAAGGQDAGGQADGDCDAFGKQDEAERRVDRQRRQREMDQLGQADAEQQPESAAERGEGDGLAEEEREDGAPRAPSATSRPISLVRSVTAMVMMVTMPTPPTSSEMPPSAPTAAVRMSRMFDSVASMSSWVRW